MGPEQRHAIFQPAGAIGDLAEITEAEAFLVGGEGAMVGRHALQRAGGETRPEAILMLAVAEGWRHDPAGSMVPVGIGVFAFIEDQVLDQRFAINAHAVLTRTADGFMCLLAGCMNDIKRRTGHIGDDDGAVGRFAFDGGGRE